MSLQAVGKLGAQAGSAGPIRYKSKGNKVGKYSGGVMLLTIYIMVYTVPPCRCHSIAVYAYSDSNWRRLEMSPWIMSYLHT